MKIPMSPGIARQGKKTADKPTTGQVWSQAVRLLRHRPPISGRCQESGAELHRVEDPCLGQAMRGKLQGCEGAQKEHVREA